MTKSIYKSFITSKNGRTIPVLTNDRTIESKYNPEREAATLLSTVKNKYSFYIVLGIASGSVIEELVKTYPTCKIIALETSDDDLSFLSQLDSIKTLKENPNIIFTSIENIEKVLVNNYIPSLYGTFRIIEQKAWTQFNESLIPILNQKINKAMKIISADYSVQCHFGKIWQSNIINNLKILSEQGKLNYKDIDTSKTAIVVAAGPSLDSTINDLKQNRKDYFIIATDTAFQSLYKQKIETDIVVSIDGQHVSHNHFIGISENIKTIFALDLCSNYSISKYLSNKKLPLFFFKSGHPLSNYANNYSDKSILELYSGAGTVTITAFDLAMKLGFKNIKIYGGDFSYINGKAYVKGTYFDTIFGKETCKLNTIENHFNKLMYRTPLIKYNSNSYSTVILNAYRDSLEEYLYNNQCSVNNVNDIYVIKVNKKNDEKALIEGPRFDYKSFIHDIKNNTQEQLILPLLPYIAWLRNKSRNQEDIVTLLKLAQSNIVIYN